VSRCWCWSSRWCLRVRARLIVDAPSAVGFSCSAPGFVDLTRQARLPGIPSLTGWQRGAFRPRSDGLKQIVDLAACCGGHA
jgi:hypothetical protein